MNKRGQTLGIAILLGLFVMIIGFLAINFLMPEITTFRTSMNCVSESTISDGAKVLCLIVDTTIIYWIWLVLSLAIGGITARFIF